ncbi:MAG: hypothetical protein K2N32_00265 [Clostridia bacterium]|nr:hypothetical protein [Clostridia bacterium]
MQNNLSLDKATRLAKTKGLKGWVATFALLALMCVDQFVLDVPFANVVFPILIICAASMNAVKNMALIALYSVIFELSCIAWMPSELVRVKWWLLEVWIGYMMPFAVYKVFNFKHKNKSILSYSAMAAFAELLYFWVSVVATILLWKVDPATYILSDLPYQALGCLATFACALPVAAIYKWVNGELDVLSGLRTNLFANSAQDLKEAIRIKSE